MGHVSSDIGAVSSSSKSGIWWQDEALPKGENWCGKYKGCSYYNGKSYVRVWYNGNNFYPEYTYCEEYLRKNGIGKYANAGGAQGGAQGGGTSAKPLTFGQKLTRVAVAVVANGVMEASKQKKLGALSGAKRTISKPKPARPASAITSVAGTTTTGAKKSLLSIKKVESISKARPNAAASRSNVLGAVKSSGTKAKGSSIFGNSKPLAKKNGGVKLGGGAKSAAPKKSGGLLSGGAKSAAPKKSGGLLSGGAKSAAPKKSGGLLSGGAKKMGGGMLGGKKRR